MKYNVFILPGFGMQEEDFKYLEIKNASIKVIAWEEVDASISTYKEYAEQIVLPKLANEIHPIVIGYSLGGMVSVELSYLLNINKLILISCAKNQNEFPRNKIQLGRFMQLHKWIKKDTITSLSFFLKPMAKLLGKETDTLLHLALKKIPNGIVEFSVKAMLNWDRIEEPRSNYIHIHGTKDKLLPIKNIKNNLSIAGGHFLLQGRTRTFVQDTINEYIANERNY